MFRYFLAWFPLLALAIANGTLRQFVFLKRMPELRAHQLSTLVLSILTCVYTWLLFGSRPPASGGQALLIGLMWLVLTVAFEFFMGLVLAKRALAQVVADYNVLAGRVWTLYLAWLLMAPWVVFRVRG